MAKSLAEISKELEEAARRARTVREAAEALREASAQPESETLQRQVTLTPGRPLIIRERER